jgi:hypothetical protein
MKKLMFVALVGLALAGCLTPPEHTVFIDLDGDGRIDALAVDADSDAKPDLDANGMPCIVAGSQGYKIAEGVDSAAPELLALLGGAVGLPILIGIGAAWKGARFGRIFMNTVMSIQAARQRLKTSGNDAALELLDETLQRGQTAATIAAIEAAKKKAGVKSVTE